MAFETIGYQANDGEIYKLKIDSSAVTAAGGSAGSPTSQVFVKNSKGNREYGIRPRQIILADIEFTTGGRKASVYRYLPVTTEAAWNGFDEDGSVSINGTTYSVVGKRDEDY